MAPRQVADTDGAAARASLARRRTEKISEVVAREIVHDMRGLPPGTMLPPEATMLEKYGIGRASLRESLRILEVQGLIIIRPGQGGGPMVVGVDARNFARMASLYFHLSGATYRDVVEARLIMEPVMARLAAMRSDPQELEDLRFFLQPPPDSMQDADYLRTSTGFHSLISGLSSNPVLNLVGQAVKDIYTDRLEAILFEGDERYQIYHQHAAIARAIMAGQANRAEKLMREHMEEFVEQSAKANPGALDEVVDWR